MNKYFCLLLMGMLLILHPALLPAQSIQGGAGIAAVENFSAQMDWGIGVSIPISSCVCADLSYDRWQGDDENYVVDLDDADYSSDRHYYGKSGLNLLIQYTFYDAGKFSSSIGAGLGRYEKKQVYESGDEHSFYISAFTIAPVVNLKLSERIAVFARILLSTEEIDKAPDWGLVSMGLKVSPF